MSTVTPVTTGDKVEDRGTDTSADGVKVGSVILEHLRLDQLLEQRDDWKLYLADDQPRSELVLVVLAKSQEALARALSDLGAASEGDTTLQQTTWRSLFVVELTITNAHVERFGRQFLAVHAAATGNPTLASPSAPPESRLAIGSMFAARYRIDGVLGRGGMGEVYRAYDSNFQRAVALKVVRVVSTDGTTGQREDAKERLLKEARVVATLKHPHIVEIYDAAESESLPYLALELCDGGNLQKVAKGASQDDRLRWLMEIANALAHAHDHGIVHRDVKPANVVLTADRTAKVTDFGIAKAVRADRTQDNSTIGPVGTPLYMAPEQLLGGQVDARADQYAWALVAHELLTGSHPRANRGDARSGNRSITMAPSIPPPWRHVIARAMLTEPDGRYPNFQSLLADMRPARVRSVRPRVFGVVAACAIAAAGLTASARHWMVGKETNGTVRGAASAESKQEKDGQLRLGEQGKSVFAKAPDSVPPEARAAYDGAVQLWNDASPQDALVSLDSATAADSSFARAHLFYALIDDVTRTARQHYQLAAQHRGKLSGPELELLDALGPSLGDPADLAKTRKLLERVEQQLPDDPDIPLFIASRYLQSWDGKDALPFADRAMAWPRPIARLMRARALAKVNRLDQSRAEYAQCFASSPSATGCLRWNAKLDAADGQCESVQNLGRRLIAAAPNNLDGYYFLAGGLAGQSSPVNVTQAALETRWAVAPGTIRSSLRLQDTFYLQASAGAFDDAERTLDAWEADVLRFEDADHRGRPAVERLLLNLELGRNTKAAALARKYLEQSRAWTGGTSIVFDIEAYRVLYWAGAIDRKEFGRLRDEWLIAAERQDTGLYDKDLYRWYEAYVEPVVDAEDALLAVSRRPPNMEEPDREIMQTQSLQKLGRMYLLAGRLDEALVFLRRAVEACFYRYPFHQMWSNLDYAKVLSQRGESALALKSLETISRGWGNASRSKTNQEARDLSARIRSH